MVGGLAAIALFIYGLQGFSRELQAVGGERLKATLGAATQKPWRGYLFGIVATTIIQSSSAVTAFMVTFVDAGIIGFRAGLPVLLGANVGTASTAFLISFKIGAVGSIFIIVGLVCSVVSSSKVGLAGRALFYFGLILYALNLVSEELAPLREHAKATELLSYASAPLLGILVGAVMTAVVQSSSITIGLAVVLTQQGLLPLAAIVPLVVGSNIGSTSTALLASLGMGPVAKRVALANTVFNVAGAVVVIPLLVYSSGRIIESFSSPGYAVAVVHLAFNVVVSAIGFGLVGPLERWLKV